MQRKFHSRFSWSFSKKVQVLCLSLLENANRLFCLEFDSVDDVVVEENKFLDKFLTQEEEEEVTDDFLLFLFE